MGKSAGNISFAIVCSIEHLEDILVNELGW